MLNVNIKLTLVSRVYVQYFVRELTKKNIEYLETRITYTIDKFAFNYVLQDHSNKHTDVTGHSVSGTYRCSWKTKQ